MATSQTNALPSDAQLSPTTKVCSNCKQVLSLSLFYKNKLTKDHRASWCMDCDKARNRSPYTAKYRLTDNYRQAQRKYLRSDAAREKDTAYQKRARLVSPEKIHAREVVHSHKRHGRIQQPSVCQICYQDKPLQAHHADYAKPLNVTWLCAKCHSDIHRS